MMEQENEDISAIMYIIGLIGGIILGIIIKGAWTSLNGLSGY